MASFIALALSSSCCLSFSLPRALALVVECVPLGVALMCPASVASSIVMYFCIASAVSAEKPLRHPAFAAAIRVVFGG